MPAFLSGVPDDGEGLVVSVMSSGTRSLLKELGLRYARHIDGIRGREFLKSSNHPWHVPVREPVDHMLSVARKNQKITPDKWVWPFLDSLALLIEWTESRADTYFYKTSELEHHIGHDDSRPDIDYPHFAIESLTNWMTEGRRAFFGKYYG